MQKEALKRAYITSSVMCLILATLSRSQRNKLSGDTCDVSVALKLKPCLFGALQEVSGSLCQKQVKKKKNI